MTFFVFNTVYFMLYGTTPPTPDDLEFLLGFCEGDGGCCYQKKKQKKTGDFSFRITQRSVKILHTLQNLLDIGGTLSPQGGVVSGTSTRLIFSRRAQVLCLLVLFDGQFRFVERDTRYTSWARLFLEHHLTMMIHKLSAKLGRAPGPATLSTAQDLWAQFLPVLPLMEPIPPKKDIFLAGPVVRSFRMSGKEGKSGRKGKESVCTLEETRWYTALLFTLQIYTQATGFPPKTSPVTGFAGLPKKLGKIDTDTPWLSGFMEAEGTFRSQFYGRPQLTRGYSVALGVEFRQNGGYQAFSLLHARFGGNLRTENKSVQLRIAAKQSLKELKDYFLKFPLRGRKHIAQSRWMRAYRLRDQNLPLPPVNTLEYRRFVRVFQSVNYVRE